MTAPRRDTRSPDSDSHTLLPAARVDRPGALRCASRSTWWRSPGSVMRARLRRRDGRRRYARGRAHRHDPRASAHVAGRSTPGPQARASWCSRARHGARGTLVRAREQMVCDVRRRSNMVGGVRRPGGLSLAVRRRSSLVCGVRRPGRPVTDRSAPEQPGVWGSAPGRPVTGRSTRRRPGRWGSAPGRPDQWPFGAGGGPVGVDSAVERCHRRWASGSGRSRGAIVGASVVHRRLVEPHRRSVPSDGRRTTPSAHTVPRHDHPHGARGPPVPDG